MERLVDFRLALAEVLIHSLHLFAGLDVRFVLLGEALSHDFEIADLFVLGGLLVLLSWVVCLFMMLFVKIFGLVLLLMHHLLFLLSGGLLLELHFSLGGKLLLFLLILLSLLGRSMVFGLRGLVRVFFLVMNHLVVFWVGFVVDLALSEIDFLAWLDFLDDLPIFLVVDLASLVVLHVGGQMLTVGEFDFAIDHLWVGLLDLMPSFMVAVFLLMVLLMDGFAVVTLMLLLLLLVLLNNFGVLLVMFSLMLFVMNFTLLSFLMVMLFHSLLDMFLIKHVLLNMLFLIGFDHVVDIVQILSVHQSWLLHEGGFTLVLFRGDICCNIFCSVSSLIRFFVQKL